MEKYYSQHGEDFFINQIFNEKKSGFFVEIGCLEGTELSNTYFFEKKGWNGICIEAHKDYIELLKKNRPHAQIVHCAVGEKDEKNVTFYANKIGSLSTLDRSEEARWEKDFKDYFTGFEEQTVDMKTLTTIFDELNVTGIDFISLDIEGYEVKALSGMDLSKYRPRVFIIEYKDEPHKKGLESILFPSGYKYLGKLGCNLFYGTEIKDRRVLNKNHGIKHLITFDKDGNEQVNEVLLNPPSTWTTLKHKLSGIKKKLLRS